jgi:pyruvyltransferase
MKGTTMKTIRVAYPVIPNAGDLLNEYICRDLFGVRVKSAKPVLAQLSGIGSGLSYFQYATDKPFKSAIQKLSSYFTGDVHIWGTGFICHSFAEQEPAFYRKQTVFHAVRGQMSKERVEKILGRKLDIPVCDAGILTSELFAGKTIKKRFSLGIIPHFREQEEPVFAALLHAIPGAVVINLREDPMKVFEQIGSCEAVVSSSLHGLIIADSFHIPNLHMPVSKALRGDGFKFEDYYSGFGLPHEPFLLREGVLPRIQDVLDRYRVTAPMVEQKKQEMIQCFPKELIG